MPLTTAQLPLRRSTLLVAVLALLPLLVVNLKGDGSPPFTTYTAAHGKQRLVQFRHGWPRPYLWRTVPLTKTSSPWSISVGDRIFEPTAIATNALFGLCFLIVVCWACRRRSGRWGQTRLHGLLLFVALLSIAFAWRHHQQKAERRELEIQSQLERSNVGQITFNVRPVWLRILLPQSWMEWLQPGLPKRADGLTIASSGFKEPVAISELNDLTVCEIESYGSAGNLQAKLLQEVIMLEALERLRIGIDLRDSDLASLRSKHSLNRLEITGSYRLTDAGIAALESFPSLRFFSLGPSEVTWTGIKQLQFRRSDLEIDLHWNEF